MGTDFHISSADELRETSSKTNMPRAVFDDPVGRSRRRFRRWAWAVVVASAAIVVACEGSLTVPGQNATWGFITIAASKNNAGEYRVAPLAQFFKGNLATVPNAQIVFDSCVPGLSYEAAPEVVAGVTFLDAGDQVLLQLGQRVDTLPRVTSAINTTYQKAPNTTIGYTPGDSIAVTIPGAVGGYPGSDIRGKSAEPFTSDPVVAPTSTNTMNLKWTPATDFNSAMIVSLRYQRSQDTQISQQILCSFTDDGTDSIPFRNHRLWSDPSNVKREAVFTRLRTSIKAQGNGVLEILSRFQNPTPTS